MTLRLSAPIIPNMRTITTTEASNRMGRLVLDAQREPIVLTRRGEPVAVVVGREDWDAIIEENRELAGTGNHRYDPLGPE